MQKTIFDVDGTLIDPKEGICAAYAHTFNQLGRQCPPEKELVTLIGPPLRSNFAALLGEENTSQIKRAVEIFRGHYDSQGFQRSNLYPGIAGALEQLANSGAELYIATSKPAGVAAATIDHHKLNHLFRAVHGNIPASSMTKGQIIAELVSTWNLKPDEYTMVGDRAEDVKGAAENGIRTVGVTWGYARSPTELQDAGAIKVVSTMEALVDALLRPGQAPRQLPAQVTTPK